MRAGELIKPRGTYHLGGNIAGGDPATYEPAVWRLLFEQYAPRTVLDVGCGIGRAMLYFQALGCRTIGIDGLEYNARQYPHPMIVADLTRHAVRVSGIDLAWSCEVAEHIPEKHVDKFIRTLLNGKVIAMTAAGSEDKGWHHRNCRPTEYWVEQMKRWGCRLHSETECLRSVASGHFRKSGMLFTNPWRDQMVAARDASQFGRSDEA